MFLKIITEVMILITGSSSWNIEVGQNLVKTNIGSTNSGCNVLCILRSNSLQYVGPATEEKKVEYIIRRFNPHRAMYVYYVLSYTEHTVLELNN